MEEEEVKIVEKPPKIKTNIDDEVRRLILERKKKPRFIRQQLWQFKKLDEKWRRPRGRHSKQRRHFGYRPPVPRIGYSSPKKVRGLHPSGFREKIVYNVNDLEGIDGSKEAVRIAGTVGRKKRMEIIAKADEMGIRVLNRVL
ncbi:MAG TPA: 50S ribosomal protein L32e [Thermoplasmata archaeon]|nr:50S ribosomal protein L32e [Thermoplasmata archaeon]